MKRYLSIGWLSFLFACGDAGAPAGPEDGGDEDSPYPFVTGATMLPGDNCRACHGAPASPYPEALPWTFAGTVFEGPDSDVGKPGVTVRAVDAEGNEATATSNEVGNFFSLTPLVAPYVVSLEKDGRSVTMSVFPPAGGCNACHAKNPVGGAPGRLFLPAADFASAATCDGDHTVRVDGVSYDCAPYRCGMDPDACLHACETNDECAEPATCLEGRCQAE